MNGKIIFSLSGTYCSSISSIAMLIKNINKELIKVRHIDTENKIVDLSRLEYMDSNLCVILYAYLKLLIRYRSNMTNENYYLAMPHEEKLATHLKKNNFCSLWGEKNKYDYNNTIIKISENRTDLESIIYLYKNLSPKLLNLGMKEDDVNEFISYLGELCTNAFQHGKSEYLYLSGQFYPNKHELDFTFFNIGNTFTENISKVGVSQKYISWAFIQGNTTSDSYGLGLSNFMDILNKYDADIVIISDNEIYHKKNGIIEDKIDEGIYLPGTMINIKFNLDEYNVLK